MCYPEGSVSHAVNDCPVCKAFVHPRCPHVREVCRNRALHPQLDVVYLKNAEVDWFNGCGYCKWARLHPSQKPTGFPNPGWPGCCRPPAPSEYRMIQAADWRSVSIVHHIPIPPEIKAVLDGMTTSGRSTAKLSISTTDRKSGAGAGTGGGSPPSSKSAIASAVKPTLGTNKVRASVSPKSPAATLSKATASSVVEGTRNSLDKEKPTNTNSAHSSPGRKHIDLDPHTTPRRNSGSRAPLATPPSNKGSPDLRSSTLPSGKGFPESRSATLPLHKGSSEPRPSIIPSNKGSPDLRSSAAIPLRKSSPESRPAAVIPSGKALPDSRPSAPPRKASPESRPVLERRRSNTVQAPVPTSKSVTPVRNNTAPSFTLASRQTSKNDDSASVSSGSSDSLSDNTVTSDGGFTDYLSDESEAELQRQAEAKAALLAQMQAEELEFKAARQQLAHVDLRPPKTWNPTNITNNNTAPRLTTSTKG
ncbi:hypothetical protein F5878DRAFT_621125 [Lentinula raphanica]|uniref:Uncharacterized protein n=1 Tax=Lentinula raphanica TaxID=153919 RepID=A0AA38UE94_9AGAR|nr:hypothetical protein C8R42DRAFT_665288 [Lentinula raphanica]KAJ3837870.1 hypothetical protein F5878DRAFT_621125 [Lentinula raphanica]